MATKQMAAASAATKTETDRRVLVVRDSRSISWPDGEVRGTGRHYKDGKWNVAYAVWSDDPFIADWHHNLRELAPGEKTQPVPREAWPLQWRRGNLAGDKPAPAPNKREQRKAAIESKADSGSAPPLDP